MTRPEPLRTTENRSGSGLTRQTAPKPHTRLALNVTLRLFLPAGLRAIKTRFELNVPLDTIRIQKYIVTALVRMTAQDIHFEVALVSPSCLSDDVTVCA